MKTCTKCGQDLPIQSFALKNRDRGEDSPRQSICIECNRESCRARYKKKKHSEWSPDWPSNRNDKFVLAGYVCY